MQSNNNQNFYIYWKNKKNPNNYQKSKRKEINKGDKVEEEHEVLEAESFSQA